MFCFCLSCDAFPAIEIEVPNKIIMKALKILVMLATATGAVALSSCGCCTGEERAPKLRKLPQFNAVPIPDIAPVVEDAK